MDVIECGRECGCESVFECVRVCVPGVMDVSGVCFLYVSDSVFVSRKRGRFSPSKRRMKHMGA